MAAAIFTHGMVFSGMYLDEHLPTSTYQGYFQQFALAVERLWSYAHGWQPMSHIRDFGPFYAQTVHLVCPLFGFVLFGIISRQQVVTKLWRPVGIALLLSLITPASALEAPLYVVGLNQPWVAVARTLITLAVMLWSVDVLRSSEPGTRDHESLATA
jgi:hypothetical protein